MNDKLNKIQSEMKKGVPIVLTVVVLLAAVYFWKSLYVQIESYERGVILQFGHLSSRVLGPGPHYRFPYPIQDIYKVDVVNDRKLQIGFAEVPDLGKVHLEKDALTLTRFGNLVDLEMEVNYFISDPAKYILKAENPDSTVKQSAEAAMRIQVGKRPIDDVLTENKRLIVQEIRDKLREMIDRYELGITIRRVQFVKANNPGQVIEAFEDVENAKQDSGRMYLDAERYANQKLPEARGNAKSITEQASGYAESILEKAKGDSARFTQLLFKYQKHRNVTRKRLYLETMEAVLPGVKKVIIDENSKTTNFLPLGKL